MRMDAFRREEIRPLKRVEYEQLAELGAFGDESLELLRGTLVFRSPPGERHELVIERLTLLLVPLAQAGRARIRVNSPLAATEDSEPQPDLMLFPTSQRGRPSCALLVVEVADSSLRKDRGIKS